MSRAGNPTTETPSNPGAEADSLTQARLETTWAGARDGLWDWDLGSGRLRVSARWKEILGYRDGEIGEGQDEWFKRVHPRDMEEIQVAIDAHLAGDSEALELEMRVLHKDGSWRWILCRGMKHPERDLIGGSITDVTAIKSNENRILHEAFHDSLTGLPNKRLFLDRLGLCLARRRQRSGPALAVIYLDLDRFHNINDSLGVDAGDDLLIEVKDRLTRILRLGDTLGRLGGDKFALLLDGIGGPKEAMQIADRVANDLKGPLSLKGQQVFAAGSMGIALSTTGEARPEDLVRDAITAMHRAKEDGATPYQLFDPEMNERAKERLRLEADLHRAIEAREFVLHYQPIVALGTGKLVAFEALLRWQHPERGMVRPDLFIPMAEETGLIIPLGKWVLEEACRQMKEWRHRYPNSREVRVAVNLSARQFENPELISEIVGVLESTGLGPAGLDLEMTESVVMARSRENTVTLQALRDLGIKLLIDDFGTGYSSLASLQSFPLDTLKIDRSFVMGMEFDEGKFEIIRTILALAKTLQLGVVAEGIETKEALQMLRDADCEHGQGYFFSAPMDAESAADWMENPPRW